MVPVEPENGSVKRFWLGISCYSNAIQCHDALVMSRLEWSWRIHFQCGLYIWLGASVSLSTGLLSILTATWLAFPRGRDLKDQGGHCNAFYDLVESICCHIHCILLVTQSSSMSRWEALSKGSNTTRSGSPGVF